MHAETYYAHNENGRMLMLSYHFSGTPEEIEAQKRRMYETNPDYKKLIDDQELSKKRAKQGLIGNVLSFFDKSPVVDGLASVVRDVTD